MLRHLTEQLLLALVVVVALSEALAHAVFPVGELVGLLGHAELLKSDYGPNVAFASILLHSLLMLVEGSVLLEL